MQKTSKKDYILRINKAIDYIQENLDSQLNLETIANVAYFSPYHFHRIFSAIVGETLNSFVKRLRTEKAAIMLINNPKYSITTIALKCGFSSSAVFSRAFREHFGKSPTEFRKKGHSNFSKNCKKNSKKWKEQRTLSHYNTPTVFNSSERGLKMKVEVKKLPQMSVAYIRHIGPYKGDGELFARLFRKLMTWAGPRGLIKFPETQVIAVYDDDPEITDEDKLRVDACITVPKDTKAEGEIGRRELPGGKYAVAHFELSGSDEYQGAWDQLCGNWLPESGYQADHRPCIEIYLNDPKTDPEGKHIVDICVPVKPL